MMPGTPIWFPKNQSSRIQRKVFVSQKEETWGSMFIERYEVEETAESDNEVASKSGFSAAAGVEATTTASHC